MEQWMEDLRSKAEAATEGPWECREVDGLAAIAHSRGWLLEANDELTNTVDRRFIASAYPERILQLISLAQRPKWTSLTEKLPEFSKSVLLLWEKNGHVEDGAIYESETVPGDWYHVLFDGESLNNQPTHWMERP